MLSLMSVYYHKHGHIGQDNVSTIYYVEASIYMYMYLQ